MTPQERAQDIKGAIVAVVAFLTALWGWLGWGILLLACAMLVDYITGSAAARAKGEWSSDKAREGLRHKLGEIVAVGAAGVADLGVRVVLQAADVQPIFANVNWPDCFSLIVVLWYFFTELGSILENAGELGAPIPPWLRKGIAVLQTTAAKAAPEAAKEEEDEVILGMDEAGVIYVKGKHEKNGEKTEPKVTEDPDAPDEGVCIEVDEEDPPMQEIIADLKDVD